MSLNEETPTSNSPLGFLEIIYGVIVQPGVTFQYLAVNRPVFQAAAFVFLMTIFNFTVGLSDMESLGSNLNLPGDTLSYLVPLLVLSIIAAFIVWFLNTAAVNLFSQLFGGEGNGVGLLTTFSFAMLPMLLTAIAGFGVKLLGLGAFSAGLINFSGFVWVVVLHILALSEVEQFSLRKAIVVYFAVPLSIILSVLVFVGFTIAFLAPWMSQLPFLSLR